MVKLNWVKKVASSQSFVFFDLRCVVNKGVWIEGKNSRVYTTEISICCWRRGIPFDQLDHLG
jgi:hypothetical protein